MVLTAWSSELAPEQQHLRLTNALINGGVHSTLPCTRDTYLNGLPPCRGFFSLYLNTLQLTAINPLDSLQQNTQSQHHHQFHPPHPINPSPTTHQHVAV